MRSILISSLGSNAPRCQFRQKWLARTFLIVFCLNLAAFGAYAQNIVKGTVKDEDNKPIQGVTVVLQGAAGGTTTDAAGEYSLSLNDLNGTLVFSFVGYQSQQVPINNKRSVSITLVKTDASMQNVVVIGYGTQTRTNITTSVSKLDTRVLENVPLGNVATAMQGTMAGVKVQTTSGMPGVAPRVIVRGGTSINNPNGAAPLTIVDGVIRTMSNISSGDIESIQVLKDAASTAIYGARGSNGVVLITTKSGKAGKTHIDFSSILESSKVARLYQMASAEQYITLGRLGTVAVAQKLPTYLSRLSQPLGYGTGNDLTKNTDYTTMYLSDDNKFKLDQGWQAMPDPVDPTKTLIYKETNFMDLALQTGLSTNNHITLSGGSDKATFNAGIGYLDGQGTAITTFFKMLTLNLNGEVRLNKKLSFFARTLYGQAINNNLVSDSYTFWGDATRPTAKYTYEDGTLAPGRINQGNPAYHMKNRDAENRTYNMTLSTGAHWDILPGLSFDPVISTDNTMGYSRAFQPSYGNGNGSVISTRVASAADTRMVQSQADAVLNYNRTFSSDHTLGATAGFSYYKRNSYNFSGTGQGASTDLIPTLNASSQFTALSSTLSDQVLAGYFSRINYDYKQKYLLSLNMRYDGASNLGADHKWGLFPGLSVGWNMHKEKFWESVPKTFSGLKLRGSYGVNGNISQLGDFTSEGTYAVGGQYAGGPVISNTGIPNPDLQWERSKTLDFGSDIGLVNNRFNILIDIYRRVTDKLITTLSLPGSTGFTGILTNYGSLENKGFEIELNARILPATSPFKWSVALTAAKTVSKILSLPANGQKNNRVGGSYVWDAKNKDYEWKGGLQEGGKVGDYYEYKQIGVYATDEDAADAPYDMVSPTADKTKHGGDVIWQDRDANDTIDSRDMDYVGNMYPVWTGGFASYFNYKGFGLTVRMDFTTGHTIYNYGRLFYDVNLDGDNDMTKSFADHSWKKQGDITNVPRYYWQDATEYNLRRGNSQYYEKGDYLAVREVTLSYTLPAKIINRWKLSNLRINVTANNLGYITGYTGINPEDGGTEMGRYPIPKNIIVGINVSLL